MQKDGIKKFRIQDDIYEQSFWVVICPLAQWQKFVKKKYDIDEDNSYFVGYSVGYENEEKGVLHQYIWLENFNWTIKDQAVLLHELTHHVFKMLDRVGVKIDTQNNEAYAYYFEYLMKKIYHKLKPKKHAKKRSARRTGTGSSSRVAGSEGA